MLNEAIRKFAKLLLAKSGYELRPLTNTRTPGLIRNGQKNPTRGNVIEFIGPSGVGKTYIFKKARRVIEGHWSIKPERIDDKDHLVPSFGPHWRLLEYKTKALSDRNVNDYQRAKLLRYHSSVILRDIMIRTQVDRSGFIVDEGIFHNFSAELMKLSGPDFETLASSRAIIIVLPLRPEIIVNRRSLRVDQTGVLRTGHSGLSKHEHMEEIQRSIIRLEETTERAKEFGVPCLRLTAENQIERNVSLVREFARRLAQDMPQIP